MPDLWNNPRRAGPARWGDAFRRAFQPRRHCRRSGLPGRRRGGGTLGAVPGTTSGTPGPGSDRSAGADRRFPGQLGLPAALGPTLGSAGEQRIPEVLSDLEPAQLRREGIPAPECRVRSSRSRGAHLTPKQVMSTTAGRHLAVFPVNPGHEEGAGAIVAGQGTGRHSTPAGRSGTISDRWRMERRRSRAGSRASPAGARRSTGDSFPGHRWAPPGPITP